MLQLYCSLIGQRPPSAGISSISLSAYASNNNAASQRELIVLQCDTCARSQAKKISADKKKQQEMDEQSWTDSIKVGQPEEAKALWLRGRYEATEEHYMEENEESANCKRTCIHPAYQSCGRIQSYSHENFTNNETKKCQVMQQEEEKY
ncbi:uncharacterized protein V6R79_024901 [Siganus canaliculatus]